MLVGANDQTFNDEKAHEFYSRLRDAASVVPGVETVALSSGMPLQLSGAGADVRPVDSSQAAVQVRGGFVGGNYFSTAGIRLLNGRTFNALDDQQAPEAVVVSKEIARRLWPGSDPLGRSIRLDDGKARARPVPSRRPSKQNV